MFCRLTQLFFGSQCVEAGLRDDLTEQLQQHVVVGGLHVCLIVDLNATVVVHLIPLLVNIPATCEEHENIVLLFFLPSRVNHT